jgi:AAA domain
MKKIDWPLDIYGSPDDYFPAARAAEKNQIDPRADVPPAESLEEFVSQPDQSNERIEEKSKRKTGKNLVAFPLQAFENVTLDADQRGYLVKGLLPNRGLAVIWGPPKCGKSFWATDLGLHIALGWEYRDRRVQQATVVYIALEGRHGLPARLEAFRHHHNVQSAPFYLLTTPLDLAAKADALIASIEAQLADTKPGAIVIDTLNRSLVGSESKDEDMARYLAAAGKIEEKFSCLVAIVHHCGIDATRPRGHTSLSGAVEVQLAIKRGGTGEVIATVELAKDFPEGAEIFSRFESVEVGTDPDGDKITSLIVVPAEASTVHRPTAARKLSDRQRLALAALDECAASIGKATPDSLALPARTIAVPLNAWREELYAQGVLDREAKSPREDFRRVRNSLQARSLIGVHSDLVWRA